MSNSKSNRKSNLSNKSSSFHGRISPDVVKQLRRPSTLPNLLVSGNKLAGESSTDGIKQLRRPSTLPNLLVSGNKLAGDASPAAVEDNRRPRLTKLLLNVTIGGSVGAVHVVMRYESTVRDLICAALKQYVKEGRRTVLPTTDPKGFDLHYSQFSLESLDPEEKLMTLGSRNFYLCPKSCTQKNGDERPTSTSCSKEAEKAIKTSTIPWLKFMDFLL